MAGKIPVKPKVLEWARQEAGLRPQEAAQLVGLDPARLADFESGRDRPTIAELHRIAEKYGVATLTLLLTEPMAPPPTPEDFRTVGGASPALSSEGKRAIREVARWRELIADLVAEDPQLTALVELPIASPNDPIEALALRERTRLQVSIEDQLSWPDTREAFNHWRWRVEAQGILVFLIPLKARDFRGFSFWNHDGLPTVAINSEESEPAQSFTLFHEYAHLLRRQAALCNQKENTSRGSDERFCNQFAAGLLMPRQLVMRIVDQHYAGGPAEWSDDDLGTLARKLKVSMEACALRLEELGLAPEGFYRRYAARWEADTWIKPPRFGRGGGSIYHRRFLNRFGGYYVSLTLRAMERGLISSADAGDLLGARAKHLGALQADLMEQRAKYAPAAAR